MCGIVGFWTNGRTSGPNDLGGVVARMAAALSHRGPDGEGLWINEQAGIALGHRRLAIVDPTEAGRQPMRSADGRYTLIVNGELYNYRELREELERAGSKFRGTCDSEVLLESIAAWGLDQALQRFNGMFAFALWDSAARTLHLVRDRMGEKPLYYGWWGGSLVFASELKALRLYPGFPDALDLEALAEFFQASYIGGNRSVYRAVRKLPPGTQMAVTPESFTNRPSPSAYWSLEDLVRTMPEMTTPVRPGEAVERLDALLSESVRLRIRADVPLGLLLSGGLDSAAILSRMAGQISRPVKTFTIGMRDQHLDEAPAARSTAKHFGAEHFELYIGDAEARRWIPRLSEIYGEPFADASAIPCLCVSRLARGSVKTALGGDGGDELLSGYARYAAAAKIWRRTKRIPGAWRRAAGHLLRRVPQERARAVGRLLADGYPRSIHWHLVNHWKGPAPLAAALADHWKPLGAEYPSVSPIAFQLDILHLDAVTLLPGDLLVKVDRASMAESLELRLPFLDPDVVRFCLQLPSGLMNRDGQSKWILRQVLKRRLPETLIAREKKGFAVPLADWLRGPLREWAEELLSERSLRQSGVLAPEPVRKKWSDHCSGRRDQTRPIWNALMFQAWHQTRKVS